MLKHTGADKVIESAETAYANTQHAASEALNGISHAVDQGWVRAHDAGVHLRDAARHGSQGASSAIRHDPVKSVLIAAATGAALMALVSLLTRSYNRN
jgi:hypothetical protein